MEAEELYFWNVMLNDAREAEEMMENIGENRPRFLSDLRFEAFNLTEKEFMKNYRVSKALAKNIIEMLRPYLQDALRASDIPLEIKVLVALHFYAQGSYQKCVGNDICHTLSQPSVSRCIRQVSLALNQHQILRRWVHFPETQEELENLRLRFYQKYHFPGIVGVVDGTHVAIVRPKENEEIYVNRKHFHSLNVQLVCDENLKIMSVNARFPGSCHDAHIWRQSEISRVMENISRNIGQTYFLLGDSGYPLRPWLLTPLNYEFQPETPEARFQRAVVSIRASIERCNGRLKNMWRCLLKHRVLHYAPDIAANIVNACVVLHNMCLEYNIPEPNLDEVENVDFGIFVADANQQDAFNNINDDLAAARNLRQAIIANHFA